MRTTLRLMVTESDAYTHSLLALIVSEYGRGVCFSRDAIFSDMYAGTGPVCYMFRSKVIVGEYSEGDSFMDKPPVKPVRNNTSDSKRAN